MDLESITEPLAYDTAFWLLGFESEGGIPDDGQWQASAELQAKLRALGIAALLMRADVARFVQNLSRAAGVRLRYLQRMRQSGRDKDLGMASARMAGLLDALACGDHDTARQIAWLSPRHWRAEREYEDDFCYAQVLHRLVHGVGAEAVLEPLFERWRQALQHAQSVRLDAVQALASGSASAFAQAFEQLIEERQAEIAAAIRRCQLEDAIVTTNRHVFVEGLALLRLARRVGIEPDEPFLFCPELARRAPFVPPAAEPSFQDV